MEFLIADTFTDSLNKLTGDEQKVVKTTAFDLQMNPANPGMQFHKLGKAKDKNFWSVRVSKDIRIIVHKTEASLMLCYVDHHNKAYEWAERRKLETHPRTGAAQLIEIRERVQEIPVPKYVKKPEAAKPPLFANLSDDQLLSYGVPVEWIKDVRFANEEKFFEIAEHLPGEAAEALFNFAAGAPQPFGVLADRLALHALEATSEAAEDFADTEVALGAEYLVSTSSPRSLIARVEALIPEIKAKSPFAHPDAQRRFRVISSAEELERALNYPWEKWMTFLHPEQRQMVEKNYNGPARVSGSAGTGKTIVALHRAAFLARANPDARVLLTTFSDALANALRTNFIRLIGNEPRLGERIEVHAINEIGRRLYELNIGPLKIATHELVRQLIAEAATAVPGHKFPLRFLLSEWEQIVDAWQLQTWDAYRDVRRLGKKTRLPEKQRSVLWAIFERVQSALKSRGLVTTAGMFDALAARFAGGQRAPFDFAVVDEAQDLTPTQLRFLAAISGGRPNSLFFAGDLGQRIFQQAFSWKSVGIDIRGRSRTLHINYRTSHQIRTQADRLLDPLVSDVDGNVEERRGTVSVFNGPSPEIKTLKTPQEEIETVARWLSGLIKQDIKPHEIAVFVRSTCELPRAQAAVEKASLKFKVLDEHVETVQGCVSISTMHLAKGLEFRAVAVMACDGEVIPLQERIEAAGDEADLKEVYDTERHLLYVACTRARDHLLVTSGNTPSEFLADMQG
jgi:superfamily I DNA/RNA helicase/mRNA-degrading endonuclease RelE of RelBE toxin-antitoxin system